LTVDLEPLSCRELAGRFRRILILCAQIRPPGKSRFCYGSRQANLTVTRFTGRDGLLFELPVGGKTIHEQIKIHQVTVKLRAINTGEQSLAAHRNPATAAHAGPIHHYWI
jgi:hypothetical protein